MSLITLTLAASLSATPAPCDLVKPRFDIACGPTAQATPAQASNYPPGSRGPYNKVPEPSTAALLVLAFVGMVAFGKQRK